MLQYELLKLTCKHEPYRAIIMHGEVMHWRCKCGRIVAAPEGTENGKGTVSAPRRSRKVEGLESGETRAALHGRGSNVVQGESYRFPHITY